MPDPSNEAAEPVISVLLLTFQDGRAEEGLAAVRESLLRTRAFEGCLGVDVAQDVSDPHRITVVERWRSLADDAAYRAHVRAAGPSRLGPLLAGPPVVSTGVRRNDV